MWFYVNHILVPYQRADAAAHARPRGNLSDLYPRWLGTRELLLHRRNPYSREVTREIQVGYYGRELDANRPADPKDQQGFAYPVYVSFLLAPTIEFPFEQVRAVFGWLLVVLAAVSVPLWLRMIGWWPEHAVLLAVVLLTLGSFPVVQGLKLQQLTLVVAALVAAAGALLVSGHLLLAGIVLGLATIKPQLVLPLVMCLALWAASAWKIRQRLVWGFGATMLLLFGAAEIVLRGWFADFLVAAREYRSYAGRASMLDVLLSPFWGQITALLLIAAVALVAWRFRTKDQNSFEFTVMIALVLAVTVIIIPMFAPYNYVLALPAVLLLAKHWKQLWSGGALARTGFILAAAILLWQWVAALGLSLASLIAPAATVQKAWWLPLYTSAKIPVPLACLVPLSILVVSAWRQSQKAIA
jgi:hypothetical protein